MITISPFFLLKWGGFWRISVHPFTTIGNQSPAYVVNRHFSRHPDMLRGLLQHSPLGSYLPYIRAFKLGTVWPCTSNSLITNRTFNFDLYFLYPFRHRVKHYIIGKNLNIVNMSQVGKVLTALSIYVKMSWKVPVFYINRALMILNFPPQCKNIVKQI